MKKYLLKILIPVLFFAACGGSTENKNADKKDSAKIVTTPTDTAIVYVTKSFTVKVSGKGAPIILIPGYTCSGEVWDETVKRFSDKYECHVLTLAGFAGESPVKEPSLLKVKNEIIDYVKENKLNHAIIIGHSLGGELAIWLCESEPTLFSKAIIVDALPFYPLVFNPASTVESSKPYADKMKASTLATALNTQSAIQNLEQLITDSANIAMAAKWYVTGNKNTMAQYIYDLMTTDLRADLSKIKIPVLVLGSWSAGKMYGGTKEQTQKDYSGYFKAIPNCKVEIAEKAKHFIMLDEPEWFLKEVSGFIK